MFESEKKSSLDRLKKSLYSRNDTFDTSAGTPRHGVHEIEHENVPNNWQDSMKYSDSSNNYSSQIGPALNNEGQNGIKKSTKIILGSAIGFLLIAMLVGVYTLFGGGNFVSVENVDILISGPVSVAGGEVLSLNASVVNKNSTPIELTDLIVEFPEGTKDPADPMKDLSQMRLSLGDISAGQVVQRTVNSLMFGEEGAERSVKFIVEYRIADSNTIFYKEKYYKLSLSSSPIIISIDTLDKVFSDQPTDVAITVSSNTTSLVKDLLLILEYPFGLTISGGNPAPTYSNNIWRIGDLAPGAKRTINIKASAQGENTEERVLHAKVGIQSLTSERDIATNIISRNHTFTIERPFFALDATFDGNRGDIAIQPGQSVSTDIIWTNNSSTRIINARIEAKLSGNALDPRSISASGGYYNSANNTIVWEAGRTAGLDSIAPGESDRVNFDFSSIQVTPGQALSNPQIVVSVTATGERVDEGGANKNVSTTITRTAKLVSNLSLSSRVLRSQGPIQNSGPIPPKADTETTYTVVWTVSNTSNRVNGVQVTATLPPNVRWMGVISPNDANISFNSSGSGQITWNVGDILPSTGVGSSGTGSTKQISFQLGLTPNVNQIGTAPEIISASVITGTDSFTNAKIQNSAPSLSTRTTTDLLWKSGDEIVTQ